MKNLQLCMVYNGGSIEYFGGHHLPQLTVSFYRRTSYKELYAELRSEYGQVSELFEEYDEKEIEQAFETFYADNIKGNTSKTFVTFTAEERKEMDEYGEGSSFVFVFGYPYSSSMGSYIEYP